MLLAGIGMVVVRTGSAAASGRDGIRKHHSQVLRPLGMAVSCTAIESSEVAVGRTADWEESLAPMEVSHATFMKVS